MAFRIASETNAELLLLRRAWSAPLLFAATSTSFFFGLTAFALIRGYGTRALLPSGLTLVSLALLVLFLRNHRSVPKALRFLPSANSVEVTEDTGRKVCVSLHDLTGVGIVRRPRRRYAVALSFGDGATWELDYFAFRKAAERTGARIRGRVSTKERQRRPEKLVTASAGLAAFELAQDGMAIFWRERFSAGVLGAANLLFLGIAVTSFGLAYTQGIDPHGGRFLWGVYVLLQGVGVLAAGAALFLRHEILITPDAVEFRTAMINRSRESRDRREGRPQPRAELSFPLTRLAALAVSLEPDRGVHRLRMMTPDDVDVVSALRRTDIGYWARFRLNRKMQRMVRLPLFGLSFSDALEIRSLLAERVR